MNQNLDANLGVDWSMLSLQLGSLLLLLGIVILAAYGSFVAVRKFRGGIAARWVLICWLIPVLGPLLALGAAKRESGHSTQGTS